MKIKKFFGIVEYGVVNEFENILYEKWTKNHSDMLRSIEKIPGSNPKVRLNNVTLDSNPCS